MAEVVVYGASDDLVEIEGAIREEFSAFDEDEGVLLAFSEGTVLRVRYDEDGMWRIVRVAEGAAVFSKTEATDPDGDYSDRVTLDGEIAWVVFGKAWATR